MLSLFAFGPQSPPKGATIPYRPKAMSAGAHAVLAPQHSAQVSIHTVVIPVLSSILYKRRNSAIASLSGNRTEIELIKGSSPLGGHIFVSLCCRVASVACPIQQEALYIAVARAARL